MFLIFSYLGRASFLAPKMHLYLRGDLFFFFFLTSLKEKNTFVFSWKGFKSNLSIYSWGTYSVTPVGQKAEQDKNSHFYGVHSFFFIFLWLRLNCLPLSCQLKSFSWQILPNCFPKEILTMIIKVCDSIYMPPAFLIIV